MAYLEYLLLKKDWLHLPILFRLQIFMAGPFYESEEGHYVCIVNRYYDTENYEAVQFFKFSIFWMDDRL